MRAMMREELINREIIVQEATRTGVAKSAEVQAQLDLARQEIAGRRLHPRLGGASTRSPTPTCRRSTSASRRRPATRNTARATSCVETEDQAKGMIAELKKGGKFDELASKNSKDGGTAQRGGDLDWNVPGAFDKAFSDAMVKLEKGKYTDAPVRTRFGFHVIQLDDVRPVKFPALADVRPRLQQQLVQAKLDELVKGLRAKAKVE